MISAVARGLEPGCQVDHVLMLEGTQGFGKTQAVRILGGDWMLEQAVHEFNLIWMTVGKHPLTAFTAGRVGIIPGRTTTNYYHTILQYPENLIISYAHGWIQVPEFPGGALHVLFTGRDGGLNVMDAYAHLRQKPKHGNRRIPGKGPGGDTRAHFQNFFESLRAGDPAQANCGIANGVGASYIGLMIRQSLEKSRMVTLDETLKDPRRAPVPPA